MPSRDLSLLHPDLQPLAEEFLRLCEEQGIAVMITSTWRDPREQAALYAQGRCSLDDVNNARADAGLAPITESQNRIVTRARAGQSEHETVDAAGNPASTAFDACPRYSAGDGYPSDTDPRWQTMGAIGTALGLNWYGSPGAPFKEYPHFSLPR